MPRGAGHLSSKGSAVPFRPRAGAWRVPAGQAELCRLKRKAPHRTASRASRLTPTLEAGAGGPAGCTPAPKGPAAASLGRAPGCFPGKPPAARARCPTSGPRRPSRRLPRGDGAAAGRAAGALRLTSCRAPAPREPSQHPHKGRVPGSRAAGSTAPPGAGGEGGNARRSGGRLPAAPGQPQAGTALHLLSAEPPGPSPQAGEPQDSGGEDRGQAPGAALPGHGAAAPARCPARRGERGGPGGCGCLRGSAGGGHMRTSG